MGHSIRDMKDGENYEGALWLVTGQERQTKNGDPYWEGTFQDATGSIAAKVWDSAGGRKGRVKALSPGLVPGGVVQVKAKVDSYNGTLQLNLLSAQIAQAGQFDPSWFSPRSQRSTQEMEEEFSTLVEGTTDRDFRALLEAFRAAPDTFRRFCEGPAAKAIHHAWVGGLLEHTLALARNMLALAPGYPLLDRDLLLCACVFHDAGKVFEISSDPGFEYTTDGKLLGHIYMGARLVEHLCDGLPGFPEEKRRHLVHIVLSHQGERSLGFGSAADPATPEAIFFHHLDNLDAKLQNCLTALARSEAAGETGSFTPAKFGPIRTTFYRVRPSGGAIETGTAGPPAPEEEGNADQEEERDAKPPQPSLW
jgi:3'-5' exoribonuclease